MIAPSFLTSAARRRMDGMEAHHRVAPQEPGEAIATMSGTGLAPVATGANHPPEPKRADSTL